MIITLLVNGVHTGGHIHVATRGPVAVYSMRNNSDSMNCVNLSNVFPYPTSIWSPQLNLAGLGNELEGQLLVHDVNVSHVIMHGIAVCFSVCLHTFVVNFEQLHNVFIIQ